jgi:hypothetical protein
MFKIISSSIEPGKRVSIFGYDKELDGGAEQTIAILSDSAWSRLSKVTGHYGVVPVPIWNNLTLIGREEDGAPMTVIAPSTFCMIDPIAAHYLMAIHLISSNQINMNDDYERTLATTHLGYAAKLVLECGAGPVEVSRLKKVVLKHHFYDRHRINASLKRYFEGLSDKARGTFYVGLYL